MNEPITADVAECEPGDADPDATPVCPHCLEPLDSEPYYCPRCGESVGQLTGILPFVNIRFQMLFIGRVWRKAWHDTSWGVPARLGALLLIFGIMPILLPVATVITVWELVSGIWRRSPPSGGTDAASEPSSETP